MFVNYFGSSLAKAVRDGLIEQNHKAADGTRQHSWLSQQEQTYQQ